MLFRYSWSLLKEIKVVVGTSAERKLSQRSSKTCNILEREFKPVTKPRPLRYKNLSKDLLMVM